VPFPQQAEESESAAMAKAQRFRDRHATEQKAAMDDLKKRAIRNLKRDTSVMGTSLRNMTVQYDKINELNNELLEKYNALMAGDRSENRKLLTDLEATPGPAWPRGLVNAMAQPRRQAGANCARGRAGRPAGGARRQGRRDEGPEGPRERRAHRLRGQGPHRDAEGRQDLREPGQQAALQERQHAVEPKGKALANLAKAIENEKDLSVLVEGPHRHGQDPGRRHR
jgi:hypothetical protein